jgi:hypothetical protein
MTSAEYEDRQNAKIVKWFVGVFGSFFIFIAYQSLVNGYQPTGKKSELMSIEANIMTSEQTSSFLVRIYDKQIDGGFRCRSEPIKKKAVLFYRMTEVQTFTGKSKIVPVFDAELSCKSIVSNVQVS